MHPELAAVATRNGGPFTRDQAIRAGYSPAHVRRELRSGRWTALRRGIYVEAAHLDSCYGDDVRHHALDVAAALLSVRVDAVGSHHSAALLNGISLLGPAPEYVALTCSGDHGHTEARYAGLQLRAAALPPWHVTRAHGVVVTSPARTAVDLARALPFREGVVAVDSALRVSDGLLPLVQQVLCECHVWPGIRRAGKAVAFADPASESVLESLTRLLFAEHHLPPPRTQVVLGDDRGAIARVDFYWPEYGVVAEADGLSKYRGDRPYALVAEKRRQERLENAGYVIVRLTWDDVVRSPAETVRRVRRAFARGAGRRPGFA